MVLTDKDMLELIERGCLDVRCVTIQNGGDDADIGWEVVEHHQIKPRERVIGRGTTPREAIADSQRKECPNCDGDGVVETYGCNDGERCKPCHGTGKI